MPGFQRWTLRFPGVGDGASATALAATRIELVPFVRLPGGGRLFDHNRRAEALDNHVLAQDNLRSVGDDPAVCHPEPGWMGDYAVKLSRDTDGARTGAVAIGADGFTYGTWARQRAATTNLCFEVWKASVTDWDKPDLWRQLDVRVHWRVAGGPWSWAWVDLDGRVGHNARYAFDVRGIDPFRPCHCPEAPPTPLSGGAYVALDVDLRVIVNGAASEIMTATCYDYPSHPWRDANCP